MKLTFKKLIAKEILIFFSFTLFTLFSLFLLPYCIKLVYSVMVYNQIADTEAELVKSESEQDTLYSKMDLWRPRINAIKDSLQKELDKIPKSKISSYDYSTRSSHINSEEAYIYEPIVPEWVILRSISHENHGHIMVTKKILSELEYDPKSNNYKKAMNIIHKLIFYLFLIVYPIRLLCIILAWSFRTIKLK